MTLTSLVHEVLYTYMKCRHVWAFFHVIIDLYSSFRILDMAKVIIMFAEKASNHQITHLENSVYIIYCLMLTFSG